MIRLHSLPFLCLLFTGTLCGSMIVPYMGYFIVEGLGQDPWAISVYAGAVAIFVVLLNRTFARRMDSGGNPFPLIGVAILGFVTAAATLSLAPKFWVVMVVGVPGFAASASAMSTMFSLGGQIAARNKTKRTTFNAYMRATTSTAWMIGPALAFVAADRLGFVAVFKLAVGLGLFWAVLWLWITPRDATSTAIGNGRKGGDQHTQSTGLWIAAAFIFCLSTAHFMTFTALPLFFVQEVGLPRFAPGNAFSVKTLVEVIAIFLTPLLILKVGIQRSLFATSALAVVAILFLASVQTYPQMLIGAALEGAYYGLFSTLGISFVQSLAPDRPAYATSVYWNTLMITGVLGGPAAGFIAQLYDFRTVILVSSAVAAVSAIILAIGARHPHLKATRST